MTLSDLPEVQVDISLILLIIKPTYFCNISYIRIVVVFENSQLHVL